MLEAFMQRGVEIDFNASEFVQTLKLEDIDFALSCFKPFLEEEGHQNIDLLKIIKDNLKTMNLLLFVFLKIKNL